MSSVAKLLRRAVVLKALKALALPSGARPSPRPRLPPQNQATEGLCACRSHAAGHGGEGRAALHPDTYSQASPSGPDTWSLSHSCAPAWPGARTPWLHRTDSCLASQLQGIK